MEKQTRQVMGAIKHRQRAKIDQGLAKQNLTPNRIRELVGSAVKGEAGGELDQGVREPVRSVKTSHPIFWQEDEF